MKVNKVIGWFTGTNGIGNVFELEHGGKFLLAMIWGDNKFHYLGVDDMVSQVNKGKASATEPLSKYSPVNSFPQNADGSYNVENPAGWQRLYVAPGTDQPAPEETTEDQLVFPFSISFSGEIKVTLGGISKLFKLIE